LVEGERERRIVRASLRPTRGADRADAAGANTFAPCAPRSDARGTALGD
jgi:hypothetical protein